MRLSWQEHRQGQSRGTFRSRSPLPTAAASSTHLCSRGPACHRCPLPRSAHRHWAAPLQSASWLLTAQPPVGRPMPQPRALAAAGAGRPARRTVPPGCAPCRQEQRKTGGLSRRQAAGGGGGRRRQAAAPPHPMPRQAGPAPADPLLTRRRRCEPVCPSNSAGSPSLIQTPASQGLLTAALALLELLRGVDLVPRMLSSGGSPCRENVWGGQRRGVVRMSRQ